MDITVKNISDLQSEIIRLEKQKQQQEMDLKKRFDSPSAIFSSVFGIFSNSEGKAPGSMFHTDIINLISRFVIPLTLNRTLFKGSNVLVKTLVGLVSQKASSFINEDSVGGVWDKVKGVFGKIKFGKKDKEDVPEADEPNVTSAVL